MRAFTLIEILVTISVFAIAITAFLSLFASAFHYQRKSLDKMSLLNSASYIADYMSRALRLAKKDKNGDCIDKNHNFSAIANTITFFNFNDQCQRFLLVGDDLKVGKKEPADPDYVDHTLNSDDISITNLQFELQGEPQPPANDLQPRVTFIMELTKDDEIIPIQTTVSQRQLDVEY